MITGRDVGRVTQVRIRHDNSGLAPGWYLDWIRVRKRDQTWIARCDNWLARDEGDRAIDRILPATPFRF